MGKGILVRPEAYCSTRDKHALLVELTTVADRVEALRMQVLAESDDVALEHGARSVGVLVAHEVRDHPSAQVRATRLGEALVGRYAVLGAAVREGRVRVAQAEVVPIGMRSLAATDPATGRRVPHEEVLGRAFCAFLETVDPAWLPVSCPRCLVAPARCSTWAAAVGCSPRRSARPWRCATPRARAGCTIPARWCEAHHAGRAWSRGGRTDLAEATLFCSRHHHLAHDPAYDARRLPDGGYRFRRRT